MGFFGKLFEKKQCSICGEEIGLLGNRKLEDGNCCKNCANKLSPWFDERRHSTVEQIKRQLAAREENRIKLQDWNPSMEFGAYQKLYVRFLGRIPESFVISSSSDYREANADIIPFYLVRSCDADIRESHRELKQKNSQGEEISYNPPRFEYSYEFYLNLTLFGIEYIDEMRLRLNRNTLKLETVQRGNGRGMLFSHAFDPMHFPEYREMKNELDTVCRLFSCGQQGLPYEADAAVSGGTDADIRNLLEQIRNAPDMETAVQLQTKLAMMTFDHPDKDNIKAQSAQALTDVTNRVSKAAAESYKAEGNADIRRPIAPGGALQWVCESCGTKNTRKFCSGCGSMRPAPTPAKWKCFCGAENTGKFCTECGISQFSLKDITCSECSWTAEPGDVVLPTFCPNCGKRFNGDDI